MSRHLLIAVSIALLAACSARDAATPAADEGITGVRTTRSDRERIGAPIIRSVQQAVGRATIVWNAVPDAKGYQLASCIEESFRSVRTASGKDTTVTLVGLRASQQYSVKVRALTGSGREERDEREHSDGRAHGDDDENSSRFSGCVSFVAIEPVAKIVVSPATVSARPTQTVQFTALTLDRFNNVLTNRVVAWRSSAPPIVGVDAAGLATAVAVGSASVTATADGVSAAGTMTVTAPGWERLASASAIPAAITASAYSASADAIFAAEMPDYGVGSLWKFSLATNTWTRLTANAWPMGKYRKLIYDAAGHRLLTYWDGLGQVYSIPETGGTWTAEGAAGNREEWYEAYAFVNPVSGRLSVFAGYGFGTFKNTLWEWNGTNSWLNMATSGAVPEPRFGTAGTVAVDAARGRAFFTERSLGGAPGNYDDLSVLDLATYRFTSLIAPTTGSNARLSSGLAYDPQSMMLYRFGGATLYGGVPTADFVVCRPDGSSVSWSAVPVAGIAPSARFLTGMHIDTMRHRVILVSGHNGTTWISDVWAYPTPGVNQ